MSYYLSLRWKESIAIHYLLIKGRNLFLKVDYKIYENL